MSKRQLYFQLRVELLEDRVTPTNLPSGFAESILASGLNAPTAMTLAPDGRFFVTEQGGTLRIIKNGSVLGDPFLTVGVNSAGERGLLGVALDPNFASNQFVYVYYTTSSSPIHNRLSRFTANGDKAVAGSEVVLLDLDNLSGATNHNGGALHFGADGKLYIAVGENANGNHAQTLSNLLGKMLRINSGGTIPTDNPFFNTATGKNRAIWALGLRNPFTFAFQPGTGRMFVNDVGQNTWEEINDGIAGSNYGWPTTEGETSDPRFRSPLFVYGHGSSNTTGCAITGGVFYNPEFNQFPASYTGDYFFADFCGSWIRRYDITTDSASGFATDASGGIVDLDVGPDGTLYYLSRSADAVLKIEFPQNQRPTITQHPQNVTVAEGQSATFTVSATGTPPLNYQWQRNQVDISGATSTSYTISNATMADNGARFRCIVTNAFGNATSNEGTLTVIQNTPPTGQITAPVVGMVYAGGDTISYVGTGTDPEDGTLPASAFTWWVRFHHDTHDHPFIPETTGSKTGSFVIPRTGETAANVWYRIHLRVTDSAGLTHESFRDVLPRTVTITLASNPGGPELKLDGQPVTGPHTFVGVVGITRTIEAATPAPVGGTDYLFVSWSDGGARVHSFNTPATNFTYLATYRRRGELANGLWATYWNNRDFTGSRMQRLDPTLDFQWNAFSPAPSIAADTFSSRWVGFLRPLVSENFTFSTRSSDGIRVWIDGRLIINNWTDHEQATDTSGPVALTAGRDHLIVVEQYENTGLARARLFWSSPSTPMQIVPQERFSSVTTPVAAPWSQADIGAVQLAGYSNRFSNTFVLNGSGNDIGGSADAFRFVYQTLNGDGEIVARLISQQGASALAKAGLMFRASLNANASNVLLTKTVSDVVRLQSRTTPGGPTGVRASAAGAAPVWLRLSRAADVFTAHTSTDGVNWTLLGSTMVNMPSQVFVGLAVTSGNNTLLGSAGFDNAVVTSSGGGQQASFAAALPLEPSTFGTWMHRSRRVKS